MKKRAFARFFCCHYICDGIDTVYHLAARVTYWGTRKEFYDTFI
ncbi:MAG: hypothetical protein WA096_10210 [Smithella sp.]